MKYVDQTLFGDGNGDCFRACLATVLGLRPEFVPHFVAKPSSWWTDLGAWLGDRGLAPFLLRRNGWASVDFPPGFEEQIYVGSGVGPRGIRHSCVYRGDDLLHDPHPSREGLAEIDTLLVLASIAPAPAAGEGG